jgi:hypothetical protein
MNLSDAPHGPAYPSRVSGWRHIATAGASRVAIVLLVQTCRHHYPGGTAGGTGRSPDEPATAAFPIPLLGRLPHCPFRGLLGVHSRYGLPARGTAYAVLCIEGFGNFVTSATAPIATGWNDSCRVGIAPTEERRLVTAHKGDAAGEKKGVRKKKVLGPFNNGS